MNLSRTFGSGRIRDLGYCSTSSGPRVRSILICRARSERGRGDRGGDRGGEASVRVRTAQTNTKVYLRPRGFPDFYPALARALCRTICLCGTWRHPRIRPRRRRRRRGQPAFAAKFVTRVARSLARPPPLSSSNTDSLLYSR